MLNDVWGADHLPIHAVHATHAIDRPKHMTSCSMENKTLWWALWTPSLSFEKEHEGELSKKIWNDTFLLNLRDGVVIRRLIVGGLADGLGGINDRRGCYGVEEHAVLSQDIRRARRNVHVRHDIAPDKQCTWMAARRVRVRATLRPSPAPEALQTRDFSQV